MTWSKLITGIRESFQRSSRNGARIDRIIIHHTATTNGEWVLDAMVSGSKQVSANYVPDKDGKLWGVVNEDFRAWTSSSAYWDGRSITMECVNNSTTGWTISNASYEKIAQLLADISRRYNFPLIRDKQRSTVLGHKELYLYWGDSYATACPGGIDIDRIVRRANEIKGSLPSGGGGTIVPDDEEEDEMKVVFGHRNEGNSEWMIGHPDFKGARDIERGFLVTTDPAVAKSWGRIYAKGSNDYDFDVNRADYIEIQKSFTRSYEAKLRADRERNS